MKGSRAQVAGTTLTGLVAAGGIVTIAALRPYGGPIIWSILGVLGVLLVLLTARCIRGTRRSRERHLELIRDLQRRHDLGHQAAPMRDLLRELGALPGIPHRGHITNLFTGRLDDRRMRFFQHEYLLSTGQSTARVMHTVFVTDAPRWPVVTIAPRGAIGRVLRRLGFQRGLELESSAFNETFRVTTGDEEFALTLLHPGLQSMLLENPRITWQINPGAVAMIYRGPMHLDRVDRSLDRLREFWRLAPPELEMW
jgi:hypothetical protein